LLALLDANESYPLTFFHILSNFLTLKTAEKDGLSIATSSSPPFDVLENCGDETRRRR
jgi:hypothetical protein